MKVAQISIARFHHFHLARQLERHGCLGAIFTGYPKWKLRDELGIPREKIRSFPWLQTPYMTRGRFGLTGAWLSREWAWHAHHTLDRYASKNLVGMDVLVALSGSGLHSGRAIHKQGGKYICDRGSSHIRYQDEILRDEYRRWGLKFSGVDPRVILKEETEYAEADRISVPSEFVRRSFLQMGVQAEKIVKIPYGARLDRFTRVAEPDPNRFTVLFVGQVSLRKGFLYLLQAFEKLRHPHKELVVIGQVSEEIKPLLSKFCLDGVTFLGIVPNIALPGHYSRADVFVLPSVEEGLAMVMGEAMACGCPVIATENTGAEDLFDDGEEGFICQAGCVTSLFTRLTELAMNRNLLDKMKDSAPRRLNKIGGWDTYGSAIVKFFRSSIENIETPNSL